MIVSILFGRISILFFIGFVIVDRFGGDLKTNIIRKIFFNWILRERKRENERERESERER